MTTREVRRSEEQREEIIKLLYEKGRASYDYIYLYLKEKGFSNTEEDVKYLLDGLSEEEAITPTKVGQTRLDDLYIEGQTRYVLTESGRSYYEFWKKHEDDEQKLEDQQQEEEQKHGRFFIDFDDMGEREEQDYDPEWGEMIKFAPKHDGSDKLLDRLFYIETEA